MFNVGMMNRFVCDSFQRDVKSVSATETTHTTPVNFSYSQLEKEGVMVEGHRFPDKR